MQGARRVSGGRSERRRELPRYALEELKEEMRSILTPPARVLKTVSQISAEWLPLKLRKIVDPTSFRGRLENWILPELGHHTADTLKKRDVEAFLLDLLQKHGRSPQTANHVRDAGRQLVEDAIDNGEWPAANPFARASTLRIPEQDYDVLSRDEAKRLLRAVPLRWRPLFAVVLYLGPRRDTIFNIRRRDVDLARGTITFEKTKTGKRIKSVPIPTELLPYIHRALAVDSEEWLFVNRDGNRHSDDSKACVRVLRRALKNADIYRNDGSLPAITFRGLRRCSSVLHQEAGCAPWVVSKVLGHSQASLALFGSMTENMTAKRYTVFSEQFIRQELNRLSLK